MQVTALNLHPLKSGAVRPLRQAMVRPAGFVGDRAWMVVDGSGVLVSAREEPALLRIEADTAATDPDVSHALRLRAPGLGDLGIDEPDGTPVPVRLFGQELQARPAGDRADDWVQAALGRQGLRLVWCHDPTMRGLNPAYSEPGDHTAFADAYPVTIASEASLRQLDAWIAQASGADEPTPEPLSMHRFRPNLVIDGDRPFAEDDWREVRAGEVVFRVAKPADRCVMTTIHPETLARGKEPVRTLARRRLSADRKTLFAVHLVPVTTGTIRVGDVVSAS